MQFHYIRQKLYNFKFKKETSVPFKMEGSVPEHLRLNGTTPSGKRRKFVCNICTKAFARIEHLKRHRRSHTNEKPFKCDLCKHEFTRRDLLLRHARIFHNGNLGRHDIKNKPYLTNPHGETENKNNSNNNSVTGNNSVNQDNDNKSMHNIPPYGANNSLNNNNFNQDNSNTIKNNSTLITEFKNVHGNSAHKNRYGKPILTRPNSFSAQSASSYVVPELTYRRDEEIYDFNDKFPSNPNTNYNQENSIIADNTIKRNSNPQNAYTIQNETSDVPNIDSVQFSTPNLLPINFNPNYWHNFNSQYSLNARDNNNEINNRNVFGNSIDGIVENTGDDDIFRNVEDFLLGSGYDVRNVSYCATKPQNFSTSINTMENFNNFHNNNIQNYNLTDTEFDHFTISNPPMLFQRVNTPFVSCNQENEQKNFNSISPCSLNRDENLFNTPLSNTSNVIYRNSVDNLINAKLNESNANYVDIKNFNNFHSNGEQNSKSSTWDTNFLHNCYKTPENILNKFINSDKIDMNDGNKSFCHCDNEIMHKHHSDNNDNTNNNISNNNLNGLENLAPYKDNFEQGIDNDERIILFTPKLLKYCQVVLKFYEDNYVGHNKAYDKKIDVGKMDKESGQKFNTNPSLKQGSIPNKQNSSNLFLPSCQELNRLLSYFKTHFLKFYSFVHFSVLELNDLNFQKYLSENPNLTESDINFKLTTKTNINILDDIEYYNLHQDNIHIAELIPVVRSVCLPLLMASMGSIFDPEYSSKSLNLYEISRRAIHVFLDLQNLQDKSTLTEKVRNSTNSSNSMPSKQNNVNLESNSNANTSPIRHIWLIQTLILNIIIAFFTDQIKNIDPELVKRQICAVCSIIRANILKEITVNDENKATKLTPFDYLIFESKVRTTFMCYHYCQYMRIFYNLYSSHFINEAEIENIFLSDDEYYWKLQSFNDINSTIETFADKQNRFTFKKFFDSFAFNDSGMGLIPESAAKNMLLYDFNMSALFNFSEFLLREKSNKFENNLTLYVTKDFQQDSCEIIENCMIMKNCLMNMIFYSKLDIRIGKNIWTSNFERIYYDFLVSEDINLIANPTYDLVTDFFVGLSYSLRNIFMVMFDFTKSNEKLIINLLTIFNLQGVYYNFLTILKFILNFEKTPNFKLLGIFIELNKVLTSFLIPIFIKYYPNEFQEINHIPEYPDINYSERNISNIECIIHDLLINMFNDSSYLNVIDSTSNKFCFDDAESDEDVIVTGNGETLNVNDIHRLNFEEGSKFESSINLIKLQKESSNNPTSSLFNKKHRKDESQTFAKKYQVSLKLITIAKCFFICLDEHYSHCNILKNIVHDFNGLKKIVLEEIRDN